MRHVFNSRDLDARLLVPVLSGFNKVKLKIFVVLIKLNLFYFILFYSFRMKS